MKYIEQLSKAIPSPTMELLSILINNPRYYAVSELRRVDKRNMYYVKEDLETLKQNGLLNTAEEPSFVGKNKAKVLYTKYKINLKNPIIKMLNKKINEKSKGSECN